VLPNTKELTAVSKNLTAIKVFGRKLHGQSGAKPAQHQQNIMHSL
jgi:hypothetical protein